LEVSGLPEPKSVNGTIQIPIEGVSLAYTFADPNAKSHHTTQYFEIFGNRGIYQDGWFAGTIHRAPWEYKPRSALATDKWELYKIEEDFSLTHNLAAEEPGKLRELQDVFVKEAVKYNVLPIDDRTLERLNAAAVGRPDLMAGRTSLTVYEGMTEMAENTFIDTKNRSHTITAEVEIPKGGANGVILAQAGRFGGWSLYLKGGKPAYTYNWLGLKRYTVVSSETAPPGKAIIVYEFSYDGGGVGKGGHYRLFINGKRVGEGRIDQTQCCAFSADEGADVGMDGGTPVTEDYTVPFKFGGKIARVTVDVKEVAAADHKASAEARKTANLKRAIAN
jgi:arylsulfatase